MILEAENAPGWSNKSTRCDDSQSRQSMTIIKHEARISSLKSYGKQQETRLSMLDTSPSRGKDGRTCEYQGPECRRTQTQISAIYELSQAYGQATTPSHGEWSLLLWSKFFHEIRFRKAHRRICSIRQIECLPGKNLCKPLSMTRGCLAVYEANLKSSFVILRLRACCKPLPQLQHIKAFTEKASVIRRFFMSLEIHGNLIKSSFASSPRCIE